MAAGGIVIPALETLGVRVGTHILQCGGVDDDPFSDAVEREISLLSVSYPGEERYLLRADKISGTPGRYPRRPGIPAKRPLGQGKWQE